MLKNTQEFLLKMQYIFNVFSGRDDVCLLWRPHPLLESSLMSMRPQYLEIYYKLKDHFLLNNIGIFDETPDIEKAIGVSDVYIGDAGTSVTSLFGIAGKPIFILDNNITEAPKEDDYLSEAVKYMQYIGSNKWYVTNGKNLFYSKNDDYEYEFNSVICDVDSDDRYSKGIEVGGKVFFTPTIGENVLVYENNELIKTIKLKAYSDKYSDMKGISVLLEENIYIIPKSYPTVVRINTKTYDVDYIEGYSELFSIVEQYYHGVGVAIWNNFLVLASANDARMMFINNDNLELQVVKVNVENSNGYGCILPNVEDLWLLPFENSPIVKWNPISGECKEFSEFPEGFELDKAQKARPFLNGVFSSDKLILSPLDSNMFISLDINTGTMEEWVKPWDKTNNGVVEVQSTYFNSIMKYVFLEELAENIFKIYNAKNGKIYEVNLITNEFTEKMIGFKREQIDETEIGFGKSTIGLPYSCRESALNSLENFLNDSLTGNQFNKEKQLTEFRKIAANSDGSCGSKIHQYSMQKHLNKR